jgi:hypothetical protein
MRAGLEIVLRLVPGIAYIVGVLPTLQEGPDLENLHPQG